MSGSCWCVQFHVCSPSCACVWPRRVSCMYVLDLSYVNRGGSEHSWKAPVHTCMSMRETVSTGMRCCSPHRSHCGNIYLVFWDLKKGNLFQHLWMWWNTKSSVFPNPVRVFIQKNRQRKPGTAWIQTRRLYWYSWIKAYWCSWLKGIMLVVEQNWNKVWKSSSHLVQTALGCWFSACFEKMQQIEVCWLEEEGTQPQLLMKLNK